MSSARFGVLIAAVLVIPTLAAPAAQAAAPPSSGTSFTPVSPTRVYDSRTTGKIIANGAQIVTFPTNLVPADATAVVFNLTGTDADGPTWLDVMTTDGHYPDTSNLNLVAGETRANLVTSVVSDYNGEAAVKIFTGPGALDMIVDVAGYYSPGGSRFTSVAPQRVLDTRNSAPVGPGGSVTLDLSSKVPAGATSAVFNLTGTDVTGATFVTAYPAGQGKPDASNLNLDAGQTVPNLVTVQLSADRKVTLANAHGSVDLIADLAGYYSPDSTQSFFPLQQIRVLDTRDSGGNPREPIGEGGTYALDLSGWLPTNATAAVFNLTGTNVTGSTYLTAWPDGANRPSASNLNLQAGQSEANLSITALANGKLDLFNHVGQADVITDLAGYFAPSTQSCASACVYNWGDNQVGEAGNGTTAGQPRLPGIAYGVSDAVSAVQDGQHVYALRSDGTVWGWGANASGELTTGLPGGHADNPIHPPAYYSTTPQQVIGLSGITQLQPGLALRNDGTVWSWGFNSTWRLGNGSTDANLVTTVAVQVSDLTGVVAVAGTVVNGFALKSDGTVWSWGRNADGELGDGLAPTLTACVDPIGPAGLNCASATPVQVVGLTGVTKIADQIALKSDGTVWQWGGIDNTGSAMAPRQVGGLNGAVAVAGDSYDWGYNGTGYALLADGTVWVWGQDAYGFSNGTSCGNNGCASSSPVKIRGLSGITAVSTPGRYSSETGFALKSDGTVWSWGDDIHGSLGDGQDNTSRNAVAQIAGDRKSVV